VLEALSGGNLHVRKSDSLLVIAAREGREYLLSEPLTGAELGKAGRRDTKKVKVNNRV
jgi:urea transport system permease protein